MSCIVYANHDVYQLSVCRMQGHLCPKDTFLLFLKQLIKPPANKVCLTLEEGHVEFKCLYFSNRVLRVLPAALVPGSPVCVVSVVLTAPLAVQCSPIHQVTIPGTVTLYRLVISHAGMACICMVTSNSDWDILYVLELLTQKIFFFCRNTNTCFPCIARSLVG